MEIEKNKKISDMIKYMLDINTAAYVTQNFHVLSKNKVLDKEKTFNQLNIQSN